MNMSKLTEKLGETFKNTAAVLPTMIGAGNPQANRLAVDTLCTKAKNTLKGLKN
jgi:hypothetical protein